MTCPQCNAPNLIVLESRPTLNDTGIRRRRKCESCGHLLTTYELQEQNLPKKFFRGGAERPYIVKAENRNEPRTRKTKPHEHPKGTPDLDVSADDSGDPGRSEDADAQGGENL